ncbi:glycosyltransferase family 2 protein [Staphylococcus gallinarum]|uniref:glycosyltransferase family 2 protein n=2 Tax=Staphylococcus gallinarum TaxID=1293 RepID=UPI001E2E9755|nr:glycosyltransferase family 2 protein [Staphylococcus gallinarum]MCD8872066.1 glycosyltransferase family 2 protein [Staphylococcus gallinarum]MCW0984358.1 glycosyltransferase family 2 protein [Staphylococcus gallinarum]
MGEIEIEKLISIIVSVYNKEKFIDKCIQSLIDLKIDKSKIEAIFVDDVSTDNSYEILKRYETNYDFIRCIQLEENSGGPAEPRNIGIQESKGKYVTVLDADDWLESDGFPNLVHQMDAHDSDFGFGQCFKHRNHEIVKVANFASYKIDNGLVPYELYKIFRAIGPWGKVFKRSTVIDNNIKFKNLKYAEDKLFYSELMSKSKSASMTTDHVYHVNRYTDNESLVKETDDIEKANLNFEVLSELIQMDLPKYAKEQILCRIIEMDFISRFFIKKAFLNSNNKSFYYEMFDKVENMIKKSGYEIEQLLDNARYRNVYLAYHHNREDFEDYIRFMLYKANSHKYIKDGIVRYKYPEKFNNLPELKAKCVGIHNGTRMINDNLYEVIEIFKEENSVINSVELVKINDERISKNIEFTYEHGFIYIKKEHLYLDGNNFNIIIRFNNFESSLVYASYPNVSDNSKLYRQNAKTEFIVSKQAKKIVEPKKVVKSKAKKYYQSAPKRIVTIKNTNIYKDVDFKEKLYPMPKGQIVEIIGFEKSTKKTPRFITNEGLYISANKDIVLSVSSTDENTSMKDNDSKTKVAETKSGVLSSLRRSFLNKKN